MSEKIEFEKLDGNFYNLKIDECSLNIEAGRGYSHIADGLETFAELLREHEKVKNSV